MWLFPAMLGCRVDRVAPHPASTWGTSAPDETVDGQTDSGSADSGWYCDPATPIAPPWGPDDDPCSVLEGLVFADSGIGCASAAFHEGRIEFFDGYDQGGVEPYHCRSVGRVAELESCWLGQYE